MCSKEVSAGAQLERGRRLREIRELREELDALADEMQQVEAGGAGLLQGVALQSRASACNLLHYLALRRHDLRKLQSRLTSLGLSSLGRSEAQILESLNVVRATLKALERDVAARWDEAGQVAVAQDALAARASALLGPPPSHRNVRIMVTMPSEAADDYTLVHALVKGGMDCMRINCAHDNRDAWSRMIEHLRRASQTLNRPCQVAMDLGGPKLRTGPFQPGPAVVKIRPERDPFGVTAPARVWLTGDQGGNAPPSSAHAISNSS